MGASVVVWGATVAYVALATVYHLALNGRVAAMSSVEDGLAWIPGTGLCST